MQKYLSPVINCPLRCMNWNSWGVIRSSHRIRTRSLHIHTVVNLQPYVASTVRMHSDAVLSSTGALLIKVDVKRKFLFSHMKVHEKQE